MSERFEMMLVEEDELTVQFIDEGSNPRILLESNGTLDLSAKEDVVIAVNGQLQKIVSESPSKAVAELPDWDTLEKPVSLMIRVHEFFEGWELE